MIASVAFRNFKALRNTRLELQRFNLVIGANGSGKTSLIQALLRLRALSRLPLGGGADERLPNAAELIFQFDRPHDGLEVVMSCVSDLACDLLQVVPLPRGEGTDDWEGLRKRLLGIRAYLLDHYAMAVPAAPNDGVELTSNGANLAAVLAARREHAPQAYAWFCAEVLRLFPEYEAFDVYAGADARLRFRLRLTEENSWVEADSLSQGTLYALALIALACDPLPPDLVCIEEVDRGIHPRLLREIRDLLYRLSHPEASGLERKPAQVIVTTHSPYLLDLFKDHPEEVVIAEKHGRAATFSRLAERSDLAELLAEGSLGDLWYSGVLGGVPEER